MLIKFDHLTYVTSKQDYAKAHDILNDKGYKLMFAENNLVNISPKRLFMRYPTATHDLYYYESTSGLPIEVVSYDKVVRGRGSIIYEFEENDFIIPVTDSNIVLRCLKSIGAKLIDDGRVSL